MYSEYLSLSVDELSVVRRYQCLFAYANVWTRLNLRDRPQQRLEPETTVLMAPPGVSGIAERLQTTQ